PLFAQVSPAVGPAPVCSEREVSAQALAASRELNRFCVYEIAKPHKKLKHLQFPPAASADLVRFDQDCAALSLSGETVPATKEWKGDFDKFLAQAAGNPRPLEINDRLGVRLAFLDTQPTGE